MGKKIHQPFESTTISGKFTKICNDMMEGAAWQVLSRSQRYLYLEMKRKYTQKRTKQGDVISDNANDISMPTSEVKMLYADLRNFRADMDALIECGFINLVQSGWNTRTCNIYGFSDRWKKYDEADFETPSKYRRKKSAALSPPPRAHPP